MQCSMHSVRCWVSAASLSDRTVESPQVSPDPLLLGFSALPSMADNYNKRLFIPFDTIAFAAIYKEKCI